MSNITPLIGVVQIFFAIVIGFYFWNLLRSQQTSSVKNVSRKRKTLGKARIRI